MSRSKIWNWFLATVFALSGSMALAQSVMTVDSVSVASLPAPADLTVTFDSAQDLASFRFQIDYDPEFLSITAAAVVPVESHFADAAIYKIMISETSGSIIWSVSDYYGNAVVRAGSGPLLTLHFTALPALQHDVAAVAVSGIVAWTTTLDPLPVVSVPGSVTGQVPLQITSTTASPTSESRIPVTFTFAAPVADFEIYDVEVERGHLRDFYVVSETMYTANLVPHGRGTVTVTVPAAVATQTDTGAFNSNASFSVICSPKFDTDNDSKSDFRDVVFCYRHTKPGSVVYAGVSLPEGETEESVIERAEMLTGIGDDGFAAADVDMDGVVDIRDIVLISRRIYGHNTVPADFVLPPDVTEADINANIDLLLLPPTPPPLP